MAQAKQELVVLMTHGADHELSSVAFTTATPGRTKQCLSAPQERPFPAGPRSIDPPLVQ